MAVHIRLARFGSKKRAFYRVVVTDQRNPRDGKFLENLGTFDPNPKRGSKSESVGLDVNRARLDYWRKQGAKPSPTLERLLRRSEAAAPATTA